MKIADAEILMIPGYKGSGPDHWQSRWEARLSTARRAQLGDWHKPEFQAWSENLAQEISKATKPLVLVAHSIGVQVAAHIANQYPDKIFGAFFVAPPDVENENLRPKHLMTFGPYNRDPMTFPSFTVASRNDPFCAYEKAEEMAHSWGSLLMDAGESGHINAASGHGPWPEGLMVFSKLMSRL